MGASQKELLETFLKLGYVPADAVQTLKARAAKRGASPIEVALLSNFLDPDAKGWLLAEALGIPFLEIDPGSIPMSFCEILPESMARENLMVPIAREGERLTVAVADPFRRDVFSSIEAMTGLSVRIVISPLRTISEILSRFYPDLMQIAPGEISGESIGAREAELWIVQGGVRRVVEKTLLHAAAIGLSSVRLLPAGENVLLKGRGESGAVLLLSFPIRFRRVLIEAFADIAGIPASGETVSMAVIHLDTAAGMASFRLSFVNGLSGTEAIVKILPRQKTLMTLDSVGLNQEQVEITRKILSAESGFYLLSSPGTEGVATTLFALLREATRPGTRVVTVEEQFRFRSEGYIQLERRDVEREFSGRWTRLAEALEPGALVIEHVSDPSGLSDLVHLAQGGITVLCGFRRFNFDRTLRSLLSLDVDPFILARVVRVVMHQRLVNLLCQECRRPVPAKPPLRMIGDRYREQLERIIEESSFYVPTGCERCRGRGYSGKMALVELLPFTPAVENLVSSDSWLEEKLSLLMQEELYSAVQSVHDLLRRGMVTFDDVLPFFR